MLFYHVPFPAFYTQNLKYLGAYDQVFIKKVAQNFPKHSKGSSTISKLKIRTLLFVSKYLNKYYFNPKFSQKLPKNTKEQTLSLIIHLLLSWLYEPDFREMASLDIQCRRIIKVRLSWTLKIWSILYWA